MNWAVGDNVHLRCTINAQRTHDVDPVDANIEGGFAFCVLLGYFIEGLADDGFVGRILGQVGRADVQGLDIVFYAQDNREVNLAICICASLIYLFDIDCVRPEVIRKIVRINGKDGRKLSRDWCAAHSQAGVCLRRGGGCTGNQHGRQEDQEGDLCSCFHETPYCELARIRWKSGGYYIL